MRTAPNEEEIVRWPHPMPALRCWTVGHLSTCAIRVEQPGVAAQHCRVIETPWGHFVEDLDSTTGTFVRGYRIAGPTRVTMHDPITVAGATPIPWPVERPSSPLRIALDLRAGMLTFGRDPSCDRVFDYPTVSPWHARLRRLDARILIEDLGSQHGTWINGQRIRDAVAFHNGDVIALGAFAFQATMPERPAPRRLGDGIAVEAQRVTATIHGRRIIEDASFTVFPGEMVGILGASGAGKTVLLNTLNGWSPPASGRVLLNGRDVYQQFYAVRSWIGYVPQDDVMHRDLSVGQALGYCARLRLSAELGAAGRRDRVRSVLRQLALEDVEHTRIGSVERRGLSGGQRKRANLAMELISDPPALFLDEPTTGLSSEDARVVMRALRALADEGKTILLSIHQPGPEVFRQLDHVVVLGRDGGTRSAARVAYFGPAGQAGGFFNPEGSANRTPGVDPQPDEILRTLPEREIGNWVERFAQSPMHQSYVRGRRGKTPAVFPAPTQSPPALPLQWFALTLRCLALRAGDRLGALALVAQPLIVAGVIVAAFGSILRSTETGPEVAHAAGTTLFLLALASLWFGASCAVREIVGEWSVYQRERMVSLRLSAYVGSKIAVLGGISVLQSTLLLALVHAACGLRGPWPTMLVVTALSALVGVTLGLILSALSKTTEMAIALVPLLLLPSIVLGGAIQPCHKIQPKGLCTVIPTRWAFEGLMQMESNARPQWTTPSLPETPGEPCDLADAFFPRAERHKPERTAGVLTLFWIAGVLALHGILIARDIH